MSNQNVCLSMIKILNIFLFPARFQALIIQLSNKLRDKVRFRLTMAAKNNRRFLFLDTYYSSSQSFRTVALDINLDEIRRTDFTLGH